LVVNVNAFLFESCNIARVCVFVARHWITRVPSIPKGYATIRAKYCKWSPVSDIAWGDSVCFSIMFVVWHGSCQHEFNPRLQKE